MGIGPCPSADGRRHHGFRSALDQRFVGHIVARGVAKRVDANTVLCRGFYPYRATLIFSVASTAFFWCGFIGYFMAGSGYPFATKPDGTGFSLLRGSSQ